MVKAGKFLIIVQCFLSLLFLFNCASNRNVKTGKDELTYYMDHGVMTDPGRYIYLYKNIPDDIKGVCSVTQGLMIHYYHYRRYGVSLSSKRKKEVGIRKVEDMLEVLMELDDSQICKPRDPKHRIVGNCRDFSVFTCSLLRHKKIPARVRCGFASYFTPGMYEDHWICEYWDINKNKWIMIDPQIDNKLKNIVSKKIDPLILSDDDFLPAGKVWALSSSDIINPDTCGLSFNPELKGLWFIKGNVFRDFLSLNKIELLPWDSNDFMNKKYTQEESLLFEKIIDLIKKDNPEIKKIQALYKNNLVLQMPDDWNQ